MTFPWVVRETGASVALEGEVVHSVDVGTASFMTHRFLRQTASKA